MNLENQYEKSNSRAQAGAESQTKNNHIQISQRYLGDIDDTITLQDLEMMMEIAGFDYALELRGERLRLFRVVVREES